MSVQECLAEIKESQLSEIQSLQLLSKEGLKLEEAYDICKSELHIKENKLLEAYGELLDLDIGNGPYVGYYDDLGIRVLPIDED